MNKYLNIIFILFAYVSIHSVGLCTTIYSLFSKVHLQLLILSFLNSLHEQCTFSFHILSKNIRFCRHKLRRPFLCTIQFHKERFCSAKWVLHPYISVESQILLEMRLQLVKLGTIQVVIEEEKYLGFELACCKVVALLVEVGEEIVTFKFMEAWFVQVN